MEENQLAGQQKYNFRKESNLGIGDEMSTHRLDMH